MASDSGSSSPRYVGRLVTYRNGDRTLFIPINPNEEHNTSHLNDDDTRVFVLINPSTRTYTLFQSLTELNTLFTDSQIKTSGPQPASMASIQALPMMKNDEDDDCPICLNVLKVAKVMPCKHMFHNNCIEKWLKIHGSCPVCRFTMPVEQEELKDGDNGATRIRVVYVPVSVDSDNSSNLSSNQETE